MKHLKAEPAGATQQLINERIVKMHTAVYSEHYDCAVQIEHLFQYTFPIIFHHLFLEEATANTPFSINGTHPNHIF